MTVKKWREYEKGMRETVERVEAGEGELPNYLICPLSRHSSLPELKSFVSIFKPHTLYPLTIISDSTTPCRDYLALSSLFSNDLAPGGTEQLLAEAKEYTKKLVSSRSAPRLSPLDASTMDIGEDNLGYFVESGAGGRMMEGNIEGGVDVVKLVEKWARVEVDEVERPAEKLPKRPRREELPLPTISTFAPALRIERGSSPSPPLAKRRQQQQNPPTPHSHRFLVPATLSSPQAQGLLPSAVIHSQNTSRSLRELNSASAINGHPLPPLTKASSFKQAATAGCSSSNRQEKVVTFQSPTRSSLSTSVSSPGVLGIPNTSSGGYGSPELFMPPPSPVVSIRGEAAPVPVNFLRSPSQSRRNKKKKRESVYEAPVGSKKEEELILAGNFVRKCEGRYMKNKETGKREIIDIRYNRKDPMWVWAYGARSQKGRMRAEWEIEFEKQWKEEELESAEVGKVVS
ncbi:hypothetical protein P7C70_g2824, partial [Phenoliferia sp. Uapishka_3]